MDNLACHRLPLLCRDYPYPLVPGDPVRLLRDLVSPTLAFSIEWYASHLRGYTRDVDGEIHNNRCSYYTQRSYRDSQPLLG